jgi:lipopolysaccharide export LptBFGC system permease protein LptF
MRVTTYLLRSYFRYYLLCNISLTLLYNLVAFFEKYTRFSQSSSAEVLQFIGLNIIPSFFDLIALSCWLAVCLLLRDFAHTNKWDALHMLHVGPEAIVKIMSIAGITLSVVSFFGKEVATLHLHRALKEHKHVAFGGPSPHQLTNVWLSPSKNSFAFAQHINIQTHHGSGLLLATMENGFKLKDIIRAAYFTMDPKTNILFFPYALTYDTKTHTSKPTHNLSLRLPGIFKQLKYAHNHPSLIDLASSLLSSKSYLSAQMYTQELLLLLSRLLFCLQPLILILLCFCWFFFTYERLLVRWLVPILSYPALLLLIGLMHFVAQHALLPTLILAPYLLYIALIITSYRRLA